MAYTPPQGDKINIELQEYTPPAGDKIVFNFSVEPLFYDPEYKLFSIKAWGKLRKAPSGFQGIYQRMPTQRGQIIRLLKLYQPTNPQTEKQQAHRKKYGEGVEAWRNLTNEEKDVYNKRAVGRKMSGVNLFMKEYLKSK